MKAMRLLIAVLSLTSLFAQAPAPRRAPSFALPDHKGQFHDLLDYRGKVVILEIMRTSCPHCKTFNAVLEQLKTKYPGKVAVISIVNPPETPQTIQAYLTETKSTSPMLFDMGQVAYSYARTGRIELPRVFIIDAQGMIRGDVSYDESSKPFFEKGGIMTEVDKLIARK
jgi:thiol-disulfide isomerase/thioredoxin